MIYYTTNLTDRAMQTGCAPWEFQPTETLTVQLRKDKTTRQDWYKNVATKHYFYSGLEGSNPNMRVSKENPPRMLHAFCADFDLPLTEERINETIRDMKNPPTWVERSLGGNARLVWLLAKPLPVESFDFCVFLLKASIKWLQTGLLPGLDEPAYVDPARLLCNGCSWRQTGQTIPESSVQAFFVECGKSYRFKPLDSSIIPLDVVEAAIKEKFPNFDWPVDFAVDSQGPSFWIPESTTPLSAIVKSDGMFTFSGHAEKPFYSWRDILGPEFVEKYQTKAVASATSEIYWDGKRFWRKINGLYSSLDSTELQNYFKVQCRMSSKPGPDGLSLIDTALDHIYNTGRIAGAAPHLFRPPGVLDFQGRKVLNTYIHRVVPPASEPTVWGPEGKFPFLSQHFDNLFDPPEQKWHFLAWWKVFYSSGVTLTPMPGQNVYFMGGVNVGKTLTSRGIVGRSVGGFCDASSFLIGNEGFNSELLEMPLWSVDDETMGESTQSQANFQAMLKKTAANQQFQHKKKFEVGTTTEWMGRIIVTTNLDYVSSRALGPMDNGSADKTNIYRCATAGKMRFPNRHVLSSIIDRELPYLCRWLLDWDPLSGDYGVIEDVRYGYAAKHEKTLLEQASQSSKAAPFKELLYEALADYFRQNPDVSAWRGPLTQVVRLLHLNPQNESVCRTLRLETGQRYLDMIQREQSLKCTSEPGPLNTRIWIFPRFETQFTQPTVNVFSKP